MSARRPPIWLSLAFALALFVVPAKAAAPSDAASFINDLINKALKTLDNKQLSNEDRDKTFRDLLDTDFDMPRISRFVLGPYWREASDQDKQQFQKLFEDYVVRSYSRSFSEYSGEQMKVTGSRPESETSTLVQSQVVRQNGPPAKVDWRVRKDKEDNNFKIVDVDVEGVSMVLTQREEFSSVIQRSGGTVAGLNKELQQKLAQGDTSLAAPILPEKK
jgi:phospholipid transport system substrate-binding protein